ncbi:hypothetical protein IDH44_11980 [Paenibacillus sp. IB182496]|uniref:Uncharacterized protein n=1 Tax=Paenibacillus sabuli TaxID=2772509 RepID=A0A927GRV8_9BACL|nr:hypothetical protein [Paenibacillus sabuli]MBD2845913.1 hypothetical protein [Paenibacillus sabuli]
MEVLWVILVVLVVAAIIAGSIAARGRWQTVRSESRSRTDVIDRLQAYLKSQGVKSKVATGVAETQLLQVLKKDVEQAKQLIQNYENELKV